MLEPAAPAKVGFGWPSWPEAPIGSQVDELDLDPASNIL